MHALASRGTRKQTDTDDRPAGDAHPRTHGCLSAALQHYSIAGPARPPLARWPGELRRRAGALARGRAGTGPGVGRCRRPSFFSQNVASVPSPSGPSPAERAANRERRHEDMEQGSVLAFLTHDGMLAVLEKGVQAWHGRASEQKVSVPAHGQQPSHASAIRPATS